MIITSNVSSRFKYVSKKASAGWNGKYLKSQTIQIQSRFRRAKQSYMIHVALHDGSNNHTFVCLHIIVTWKCSQRHQLACGWKMQDKKWQLPTHGHLLCDDDIFLTYLICLLQACHKNARRRIHVKILRKKRNASAYCWAHRDSKDSGVGFGEPWHTLVQIQTCAQDIIIRPSQHLLDKELDRAFKMGNIQFFIGVCIFLFPSASVSVDYLSTPCQFRWSLCCI